MEIRTFATASGALGLSPAQTAMVKTSHALSKLLKNEREKRGVSQSELSQKLGCTESKLNEAEVLANDLSLIFSALYEIDLTPAEIGGELCKIELTM